MKINLIIRTYKVDNLRLSLFKLPFSIQPNEVDIVVHNDNPNSYEELNKLLDEFFKLYPNYNIKVLQEEENQQMFMSYLKSIKYINPTNKWTMLLDDDDTLNSFDDETWSLLDTYYDQSTCIKYRMNKCRLKGLVQVPIELDGYKSAWYKWHRIYPTWALLKVLGKKTIIEKLLNKFNGTTKFAMCEDKLMNNLVETLTGISYTKLEKELINYSIYPHQINGYSDYATNGDTLEVERANKVIDNIINYIKSMKS